MSAPDGYEDEMSRFWSSEEDIERILAGRVPEDREDLHALALFAQELKEEFVQEASPRVEAAHMAAMAAAASSLAEETAGVPTSGDETPLPDPRRKTVLRSLFGSAPRKIATIALVAVASTSSLAAAGALPDPAQEAVAEFAQNFGVSLPSPADEESSENAPDVGPVNEDVQEVLDDDSLEGREKGEAVSDAADQNRQDDGANPTDNGQPEGTSSGEPDEVPSGEPEETPSGQPEETPSENPTESG